MISEPVLDRLARGAARGLPKWPAMMPHVWTGDVRMTLSEGFPGASYELTDRGRRRAAGYHMSAAGVGK